MLVGGGGRSCRRTGPVYQSRHALQMNQHDRCHHDVLQALQPSSGAGEGGGAGGGGAVSLPQVPASGTRSDAGGSAGFGDHSVEVDDEEEGLFVAT
jgi:hypothetical protein